MLSHKGEHQYRLTFKTTPVDWNEFLRVWEASFDWDMMRYPLLTQVRDGEHIYLKGNRLQLRTRAAVRRTELPPTELAHYIHRIFHIAPEIVHRALNILKRRGESYGQATSS
ncbi:hypothetical protein HRbin36_01724 [bacterium HR36]|nr:hypothetical protein HRbin36_01724 [bacterium HR36]